jgi:hypothetical protein
MLWCEAPPDIAVPDNPTIDDAKAALATLRHAFRTFPYKGATMISEDWPIVIDRVEVVKKLAVVDLRQPPVMSETASLCGLMTAVARPSLDFAPGLLLLAPLISGSGCGKGLLARASFQIAYGWQPGAFTAGHDREELEKRISAALCEARPGLLLDNINNATLASDTLASALTERPSIVRAFSTLKMVPMLVTTFITITGNGLSVSEDLLRRFLLGELDADCEDPELRWFPPGFLSDIARERPKLLAAVLTIWRWGRQNENELRRGLPLGGFETWTRWIRDPLLTLGAPDPVERLQAAKAADPRRLRMLAILSKWHEVHGSEWTQAAKLAEPVVAAMAGDRPMSRQAIAGRLQKMVGTRVGGFVLEFQADDTEVKRGGRYRVRRPVTDATDDTDAFHDLTIARGETGGDSYKSRNPSVSSVASVNSPLSDDADWGASP